MTLIFELRAGISNAPSLPWAFGFLTRKWNLHHNPGSLAPGGKTDGSAQHCRPLAHALNPQAVRRDSNGLSIEATSIVDYGYLHRSGQMCESNADRLGSGMSGYVGQSFLQNPIQGDLNG